MAIYKGIEKSRTRGAVSRKALNYEQKASFFEPKPNLNGLYLSKITQNGNYFIYDRDFTGYISPQMEVLREIEKEDIEDELKFVSSWVQNWEYIIKSELVVNRNIVVSLNTDENPCIGGMIEVLKRIEKTFPEQGRSFDIAWNILHHACRRGARNFDELTDFYPHIMGLDLYLYYVEPEIIKEISNYFYIKHTF